MHSEPDDALWCRNSSCLEINSRKANFPMIFDQMTGALYADDGAFIKSVRCPFALSPGQLKRISKESSDRHCSVCDSVIQSIDQFSDEDMKSAIAQTTSICIFATPKAKNIIFLQPIGITPTNYRNLQVLRSLRSLEAMADAQSKGFTLIFRNSSQEIEQGEDKFIVYQHQPSGRLWWSGDYRSDKPTFENENWDMSEWKLIRNWFFARADRPFPLAAYAVPKDLAPNTSVFLEDLIEESFQEVWNQGNAQRRASSEAVWDGLDLQIAPPEESMVFG